MSSEVWAWIFWAIAIGSIGGMGFLIYYVDKYQKGVEGGRPASIWHILIFGLFLEGMLIGGMSGLMYSGDHRFWHWWFGVEEKPWVLAEDKMSPKEREVRENFKKAFADLEKARDEMARPIVGNKGEEVIRKKTTEFLDQLKKFNEACKELEKFGVKPVVHSNIPLRIHRIHSPWTSYDVNRIISEKEFIERLLNENSEEWIGK